MSTEIELIRRHYGDFTGLYDPSQAVAHVKVLLEEVERITAALAELEAEGVDAMAERFVQQTKIRSMEIRGGKTNLDLEPARELVAVWVGAARAMLGDAPNYTETRVDVPTDAEPKATMEVKLAGEFERYAFVLQRVGKLTPHEARMRAERERDEARAEVARAHAEGYAQAVAVLRDDARYQSWWSKLDERDPNHGYWHAPARNHLADFLETITKPLPGSDTQEAGE